MPSIHLQNAIAGLESERDVRVELRCSACEPEAGTAEVPAISVSDTTRCDGCRRPIWTGERFWAVLLPAD